MCTSLGSRRRLRGFHPHRSEISSVMKLQKRTRYDIYLDVLEAIRRKKACSITRLSYGAGLPVDRTRKIVEFLISRGLLKTINLGDRPHYRITERGGEFLQALKTVKKFIE